LGELAMGALRNPVPRRRNAAAWLAPL